MIIFRTSVRGLVSPPSLRTVVVSVLRVNGRDSIKITFYVSSPNILFHAPIRIRLYVSRAKRLFHASLLFNSIEVWSLSMRNEGC